MLGGKSIDEKTDNKKIDVDERKETEVAQGNTSSQKLEMDHRPIDSSFEDRPPTPGAMLPDTLGDSFKPATPKMEETLSSRSNTPSPILKNPTPLTGLTGGGNSTPYHLRCILPYPLCILISSERDLFMEQVALINCIKSRRRKRRTNTSINTNMANMTTMINIKNIMVGLQVVHPVNFIKDHHQRGSSCYANIKVEMQFT
uniref:Uncharacterized protein LOC102805181 n=1 Tax=Saccoglossus kowalevskii TaxID=10224 RepID=A0ABM0MWM6_SACKO|nr:PREDICTED: uncharacterized protein LOC102805181 [Saccoglossus kowalevskii]